MLVGRESELSFLAERIELARPVVVLGEAGVGKTSLVRAAAERSGKRLVEAGALATLAWLPYLPLRRAFGRDFEVGDATYVADIVQREVGSGLLFVDDLQWADSETRGLIPLLGDRVGFVTAIRRGDPAAGSALELAAAVGAELVPLEPLALAEAADLVRLMHPHLSTSATARLVERSGGNPFLLQQLGTADEPPEGLARALDARLRTLSCDARDTLGSLALLGRPAERELIGLAGVDELVAAGLAVDGGEIAIRHALIAETTAASLEAGARRRLHSRLAELLSDPGEAARHHSEAGERAQAHERALVAAAQAPTPGERAAHLGVAAANASGSDADVLRVRAARELLVAGDPAAALALAERVRSAEPDAAAEAALLRAQAYSSLRRPDEASRELDGVVAGAGGHSVLIGLAAQRSFLAALDGRHDDALQLAEESARLVETSAASGQDAVSAYTALAAARRNAGVPGAADARDRALAAAHGAGVPPFGTLNNVVFELLLEGEPARAGELALETAQRALSLRLLAPSLRFRGWHAGIRWHLADPTSAVAQAEAVLAAPLPPSTRELVESYLWLALVDLGRGAEIRPSVEVRIEHSPRDDDGVGSALWVLAELELAGGRPDAAERAAGEYLERFGRAMGFVGVLHAWARFEQGHVPEPLGTPRWRLLEAAPVEVEGVAALAEGDTVGAVAAFERAAELWSGRHERGALRCRWAAAEALRRAGSTDGARARLLLVEQEAERRHIEPLLRQARRSLRLVGVRRAAERTIDGSLTGREAEVLGLVRDGLSNDEIARRLGVARPTVVRLIRTASGKLGATSRVQAAVLARP